MTIHYEPTIHGMGTFEGGRMPGAVIDARRLATVAAAMRECSDDALAQAVTDELRRRHGHNAQLVAKRIAHEVQK